LDYPRLDRIIHVQTYRRLPRRRCLASSRIGGKNVKAQDGKEKSVIPVSTAEYNPCGWRAWLNNTTISLGMQNVFDTDPPFVAGNFENGYDESLATIKGRFWYVQLRKRF
jgi:hypothetical protein